MVWANRAYSVYIAGIVLYRAPKTKPDQNACGEFLPGENKENAFASKEYLSKALLDRVMHLELLPEIEEKNTL